MKNTSELREAIEALDFSLAPEKWAAAMDRIRQAARNIAPETEVVNN
jgi:hypothetical protein